MKTAIITSDLLKSFFEEINANKITEKEKVYNVFVFPPKKGKDKIIHILNRMKEHKNQLIWGTRGVGKTLFLKRIFYDFMEEQDVLPIFIDLNKAFQLIGKLKNLDDSERVYKENILLKYYQQIMIYRGVLQALILKKEESSRKAHLKRILDLLCGYKLKENEFTNITDFIEDQILNLDPPFIEENLAKGLIDLSPKIVYKDDLAEKLLKNTLENVLNIVANELSVKTFIILFDEFSMLTQIFQEQILSEITTFTDGENFKTFFKIAIMNGLFQVDTIHYNTLQHSFEEILFEEEYYKVFRANISLYDYFKNICNQRLIGLVQDEETQYLDFNGNPIEKKQQYLSFLEDEEAFLSLVKFAGYNFRRFFILINGVLSENIKNNTPISTKKILDYIRKTHYNLIWDQIRKNRSIQDYFKFMFEFISELVKKINKESEKSLFFLMNSNEETIINLLVYFGILTPVSKRKDDRTKTLLDIQMWFLDPIVYVTLSQMIDVNQIYNFRPFKKPKHPLQLDVGKIASINKARQLSKGFQRLENYYKDYFEILNNDDETERIAVHNFILNQCARILKKEKVTIEDVANEIKKFQNWERDILRDDVISKQDFKEEVELIEVKKKKQAKEDYIPDEERKKLKNLRIVGMGSNFIEELILKKISAEEIRNIDSEMKKEISQLIDNRFRGVLTRVYNNIIKNS